MFAGRFAQSASEADYIVVADTGSKDGTQGLLRKHDVLVHDISLSPWRFDDARNAALALVPADVDICLSLDLDEVLIPGWREAIETAWSPETTRAHYSFVASHEPDGSDGVSFLNNRLHARHGYRWRHACHEGLYPDRIVESYVTIPGLRVDHWPDETKSRGGYLDLLAVAAREEPHDARMAHYYARELLFKGRWQEALDEFTRHLKISDPAYRAERAATYLYMARCLEALGWPDDARLQLKLGTLEAPAMREAWIALAERFQRDGDWTACLDAALKALSITEPLNGYMSDPHAWGYAGYDLAAIAAWNLGCFDEALPHAERALAQRPGDPRLQANVALIAHAASAQNLAETRLSA